MKQTLGDFKAMGYMAEYYAHKIRAATYVSLYRYAGDEKDKTQAVAEAEAEVKSWVDYGKAASAQYKPQLFARTQLLDWDALTADVKQDVDHCAECQEGRAGRYRSIE